MCLSGPKERLDWGSQEYGKGYRAGYRDGLADGLAGKTADPALPELPIEALELSTRARNCLRANGFERIGDVARMSELTIRRLRNLGRKSADEVARSLHRQGIFPTAWDEFLL